VFFGFWFIRLLVVADGETHGEARDAVLRQLLEAHRQLLADRLGRRLERLGALLMRAPWADTERLLVLGLTDPDDTALFNAVALLEAHNLVLVVLELLVLLKVGGAVPHLVEPRLIAQDEPLVAVGDVHSVEPLDVVQIVGAVGRQKTERLELVRLEKVGKPSVACLIRAVHDRVVDAEVDLRHLRGVRRLERLLLDKTHNLLKVELVAVELSVQDCALRQAVDLGANVVHVRERLARAAVEPLARDGKAAHAVQLPLGVARELDVLAALVVVVGKHRVRDAASIGRRLGVLLSARLGLGRLDAFLVGVRCLACRLRLRLLRRHAARLGLLLPVALRLVDRLLERRCFVLLAEILAHRYQAGIFLKLAVKVAVGRRNRTDALLVLNFDGPHLDFTCGRLAVQGGERRNSRHVC